MKRFARRSRGTSGRGVRPTRVWVSLQAGFVLSTVGSNTAVSLLSLQAPTTLALTSDPPEDMTILRVRGNMTVGLSGISNWTLGLIVQDTDWTPGLNFPADADKRWLWTQTYASTLATSKIYNPDGTVEYGTGGVVMVQTDIVRVDVSPKVRVEAGKALYLVGYENSGAATLSVSSNDMRLLFQRSGRR